MDGLLIALTGLQGTQCVTDSVKYAIETTEEIARGLSCVKAALMLNLHPGRHDGSTETSGSTK